MFTFPCPRCGRVIRLGNDRAGAKTRCPSCQAVILAPDVPMALPINLAEALPADIPTVLSAEPAAAPRREKVRKGEAWSGQAPEKNPLPGGQVAEADIGFVVRRLGEGASAAEVRRALLRQGLDPTTADALIELAAAGRQLTQAGGGAG